MHRDHPVTVGRARSAGSVPTAANRWSPHQQHHNPSSASGTSPRIVPAPETHTTDWVNRVRTMPTRTPSPGVVRRDPARSVGEINLGPMPLVTPRQRQRYVSEPPGVGVGLLRSSGVAVPGASAPYHHQRPIPRYISHEGVVKPEKEPGRRMRAGGSGPVAAVAPAAADANLDRRGGDRGGGDATPELADDPPPSQPLHLGSTQSFDPNREDTSLIELFPSFHRDS